jgi:hypothetical protein
LRNDTSELSADSTMSFDSETMFPYRLVVASVLAAIGWGLLGGVGVWLEVMQYPAWEVVLQAGFFSGLLAAILGVAAGGQAAWRYFRRGAARSGKEDRAPSSWGTPFALITATVVVAGASALLGLVGVSLKVLKAPYWALSMQLGSVGGLLTVLLGLGTGVWALWRYTRRGPTGTDPYTG